ncbi:MAG: AbrB/MazE/SpoVT family DNA-binding domain-containing protein [Rhodospirillaceae bacterium]|nr:AbrB/MazE/SpoVT family DNA-binding domain-containing protein [Rhodospirillaceae bacterium]
MRITSKGQVTIPIAIREKAGLRPHTEVEFVMEGKAVRLVKTVPRKNRRGKPTRRQARVRDWLERMKGSATVKLSTDEIMKMTRDW